ncbi:hypothetical protein CKQ90_31280 [Klebsiella pneumoniae]|nr:hypothetical protein CKQ90_31280 [Klebsiella pneumoniae]
MGVFATRSTFRPNPIGMSLVELKGIRCQKDQPSVDPVCVSSDNGRRLASDGATSPTGRQCADGRLRHPFNVSP